MTIIRSMSIGASGLRAHSDALSAVGNNIANVNTVGYKRERAIFHDILGRSIAGGGATPASGSGSRLAHIEHMWTQGALINTGAPTDLAITGDGLFMVSGNVDGVTSDFYTRAGQFTIDESGFLVNPDGLRLQGYTADDTGALTPTIGDLQVTGRTLPATPTSEISISANLSSNAAIPTAPFDPANPPAGTPTTSVRVFDSLGNPHDINVVYEKTGTGTWTWHAMVDGADVVGGTAGTPTEIASGTLTFDSTGALANETTIANTVNFSGGATAGQVLDFDYGTSIAEGGSGFDGSTGLASESTNIAQNQDGFAGGTVSGLRIEADGTVTGVFSNGQLRTLGSVAVASFASTTGLASAGRNLWAESRESGQPVIGIAGTGGRGSIVSGALEGSNVDLGTEFVDLISYQRGFSANSRIISTSDEMLQELIALKR